MRKFLFISLLFLTSTILSSAQLGFSIYDGNPLDSSTIRFNSSAVNGYLADTATSPLWQIGLTHKPFFAADSTGTFAIMTDTANYYPANANNSFTIKVGLTFNTIVDFWHSYQTDSFHAGGIVEFSLDHGLTWQNVKGDCNIDTTFSFFPGIFTSNFYDFTDTLFSGEKGFTGTSSGLTYSRFQFFQGMPEKITGGSGCTIFADTAYVRFRFVSDTTIDTLAGWMIDSIKIEHDDYPGLVRKLNRSQSLHVFPNPSYDGSFTFPALEEEKGFNIEVYNALGDRLINTAYMHSLLLCNQPAGLYFYRVTNGIDIYQGQLLKE